MPLELSDPVESKERLRQSFLNGRKIWLLDRPV